MATKTCLILIDVRIGGGCLGKYLCALESLVCSCRCSKSSRVITVRSKLLKHRPFQAGSQRFLVDIFHSNKNLGSNITKTLGVVLEKSIPPKRPLFLAKNHKFDGACETVPRKRCTIATHGIIPNALDLGSM